MEPVTLVRKRLGYMQLALMLLLWWLGCHHQEWTEIFIQPSAVVHQHLDTMQLALSLLPQWTGFKRFWEQRDISMQAVMSPCHVPHTTQLKLPLRQPGDRHCQVHKQCMLAVTMQFLLVRLQCRVGTRCQGQAEISTRLVMLVPQLAGTMHYMQPPLTLLLWRRMLAHRLWSPRCLPIASSLVQFTLLLSSLAHMLQVTLVCSHTIMGCRRLGQFIVLLSSPAHMFNKVQLHLQLCSRAVMGHRWTRLTTSQTLPHPLRVDLVGFHVRMVRCYGRIKATSVASQ